MFFSSSSRQTGSRVPARFPAKPQVAMLTQRSSWGKRQWVPGDGSPDETEGPRVRDLRLPASVPKGDTTGPGWAPPEPNSQ